VQKCRIPWRVSCKGIYVAQGKFERVKGILVCRWHGCHEVRPLLICISVPTAEGSDIGSCYSLNCQLLQCLWYPLRSPSPLYTILG